jgi:ABC-2 type transport system permease protein
LPYALLFFVCRGYFDGLPDWPTLAAYALSLVLGFLIGFFFEASVGMVGFWFLEVTSLLYIVMTLNFFISGHMLPLDLLPQPWSGLLKALPFQYMAYFPAVVFLGKVKGMTLVYYLVAEVVWVVFFMVLSRGLFRLGLRRYSAFGG